MYISKPWARLRNKELTKAGLNSGVVLISSGFISGILLWMCV